MAHFRHQLLCFQVGCDCEHCSFDPDRLGLNESVIAEFRFCVSSEDFIKANEVAQDPHLEDSVV